MQGLRRHRHPRRHGRGLYASRSLGGRVAYPRPQPAQGRDNQKPQRPIYWQAVRQPACENQGWPLGNDQIPYPHAQSALGRDDEESQSGGGNIPGSTKDYIEVTEFKDGKLVKKRIPVYNPQPNTRGSTRTVPRSHSNPTRKRRSSRSSNNQAGIICFGVFVFLVIVAIALLFGARQRQATAEGFSRLARRYGGSSDVGGWFNRPEVRFLHGNSRVVVDVYSTGGKHPTYYTQVHFRGMLPTVRCEVYPEGMWSRVGKLMGMEDVEIGSPGFDEQYIIKGDSRAALRDLLSPAVQQQIERLRRFLGNDNVYVSFNRQELLVKKLKFIRDYSTLLQFTELAIELYDQAMLTAEKGIEFVRDTTPPEVTEAVCQICGETIGSDAVFCRRCKTPHHLDCWQYYGACSTYGCRETRYLRAKPSRRAKPARTRSKV